MWEIFSKNKAEVGRGGEKIIVRFLKKQKYKILETNYRTAFGEADIIAQKGEYLVFVESKQDQASCSVRLRKRSIIKNNSGI